MITMYDPNIHCIFTPMQFRIHIPAHIWNPNIRIPREIWNSYQCPRLRYKRKKQLLNRISKPKPKRKKKNKKSKPSKQDPDQPSNDVGGGEVTWQRDCNIKTFRFFYGGMDRQLRGTEMSDVALQQPCLKRGCRSCARLFGGMVGDDEFGLEGLDDGEGIEGVEVQGLEFGGTGEDNVAENEGVARSEAITTQHELTVEAEPIIETDRYSPLNQSTTLSPTHSSYSSPSSHIVYLHFKSRKGRRRYTDLIRTQSILQLNFPSDAGKTKFANLIRRKSNPETLSDRRSRSRHRIALRFMTARGRARYRELVENTSPIT